MEIVFATGVWLIWLASLAMLLDRAEEEDAALVVGEAVFAVVTEFTGIGDLFTADIDIFPKEDVDAVLKAGLAEGGVPNTPTAVVGAGVLITIVVVILVLARMGLRLVVLFRIGVSLWFEARTGDGDSFQVGPMWFKLLRSSFLSLLLLLLLLLRLGPFCNFISSNELLLVTVTKYNCFSCFLPCCFLKSKVQEVCPLCVFLIIEWFTPSILLFSLNFIFKNDCTW